jgi:AraC-like DNA-binding protein
LAAVKVQHQKTRHDAGFPMNVFFTDVTEFPPHWHEVVEVVYVLEGSLKVGVNSEVYTMNSRDILLISGGDVHYFVPQPKQVNRLIIQFDLSDFDNLCPYARNKHFTQVLLPAGGIRADTGGSGTADCAAGDSGPKVHRMLEEQIGLIIRENGGKNEAYKIVLMARLYDFLALLLRHVPMETYSIQEQNRRQNRLDRLDSVFCHVERNYGSDITLGEIASVANFSEYYFTRFFKEATGMTFGRYLNNYRVEKAAQLLRATDDPVTEIVFKSGFGSIKTFNRVFKQIKGCSPTSYKKTIFEG